MNNDHWWKIHHITIWTKILETEIHCTTRSFVGEEEKGLVAHKPDFEKLIIVMISLIFQANSFLIFQTLAVSKLIGLTPE